MTKFKHIGLLLLMLAPAFFAGAARAQLIQPIQPRFFDVVGGLPGACQPEVDFIFKKDASPGTLYQCGMDSVFHAFASASGVSGTTPITAVSSVIACPTCTTNGAGLVNNALMTGAGAQGSQTSTGGSYGLYYDGSFLSYGQTIVGMSPNVTQIEFFDPASPFPVTSTFKSNILINVGNCPDTVQNVLFARRNAFASEICAPSGGPVGGIVAIAGYAFTGSTGNIAGYFVSGATQDNLNVFTLNPVLVDADRVIGGTHHPLSLGVNNEQDVFLTGTGNGNILNLWLTANSDVAQPNGSFEAAACARYNGQSVLNPWPYKQCYVGVDGGSNGDVLYGGSVVSNDQGFVNVSGSNVTCLACTGSNPANDDFHLDRTSENIAIVGSGAIDPTNCPGDVCTIASKISKTQLTVTASLGTMTNVAWQMVGASQTITLHALSTAATFSGVGANGGITAQESLTITGVYLHIAPNSGLHAFYVGGTQTATLQLGASGAASLLQLGTPGSITGEVLLPNGNMGGATVTVRNDNATVAFNYNLPATPGTPGCLQASGGGVNAPMTWTCGTGNGTTFVSGTTGGYTNGDGLKIDAGGNVIDSGNPVGTPAGTAGGDLSGSYPTPTVAKVNGLAIPASAPVVGTNSSNQFAAATTTGSGTTVVLNQSPTITGALILNAGVTTLTGTAGTGSCYEAGQGTGFKIAICKLAAYANTGAAQTYTFNTAFSSVPFWMEGSGSGSSQTACGTWNFSTTASVLTLPANASMTAESCQVVLIGT